MHAPTCHLLFVTAAALAAAVPCPLLRRDAEGPAPRSPPSGLGPIVAGHDVSILFPLAKSRAAFDRASTPIARLGGALLQVPLRARSGRPHTAYRGTPSAPAFRMRLVACVRPCFAQRGAVADESGARPGCLVFPDADVPNVAGAGRRCACFIRSRRRSQLHPHDVALRKRASAISGSALRSAPLLKRDRDPRSRSPPRSSAVRLSRGKTHPVHAVATSGLDPVELSACVVTNAR